MPPNPNEPSPVNPSLPLPNTPVVELLILLGFCATPIPLELVETVGGLVADRSDLWVGTEAGTTGAEGGGAGRGERDGAGEPPDSDKRSRRNTVSA